MGFNIAQYRVRQNQFSEGVIQIDSKCIDHHNAEDRNCHDAGYAGNCIIDSRSRAYKLFTDRIHYDRR